MKIKDQARAALALDPFATTFICDRVCKVEGCNCYVRRTAGKFRCVECAKVYESNYRKEHLKKLSEYNRKWHKDHKDYVNTKARATYQLKKETKL